MLDEGVPMTNRFGGLLQVSDHKPLRFTQIINYDGTTLDPLEIFIKGRMTSVSQAVSTGEGVIGASFREIPAPAAEKARPPGWTPGAGRAGRHHLGGAVPASPCWRCPWPPGGWAWWCEEGSTPWRRWKKRASSPPTEPSVNCCHLSSSAAGRRCWHDQRPDRPVVTRGYRHKLPWFKSRHLWLFMILMLYLIMVPLIEQIMPRTKTILDLFIILVLVAAAYTVINRKRTFVLAILLLVAGLILVLGDYHWHNNKIMVVACICYVGFLGIIIFSILNEVMTLREVSFDTISGSLNGYLLMGLMWGFAYQAVEAAWPGSFSIADGAHKLAGVSAYVAPELSFLFLFQLRNHYHHRLWRYHPFEHDCRAVGHHRVGSRGSFTWLYWWRAL